MNKPAEKERRAAPMRTANADRLTQSDNYHQTRRWPLTKYTTTVLRSSQWEGDKKDRHARSLGFVEKKPHTAEDPRGWEPHNE